MEQFNNINEKNLHGFELVLHIAIKLALTKQDKKSSFGTSGNIQELLGYLDKYKDMFTIWIRKSDGMSGSMGGDFDLFIEL
jgi:hypothetical protein